MMLNGTKMFATLKAAETHAEKMNRESGNAWAKPYTATQTTDDNDRACYAVMNLGDRSVYGVGGAYVNGSRWD